MSSKTPLAKRFPFKHHITHPLLWRMHERNDAGQNFWELLLLTQILPLFGVVFGLMILTADAEILHFVFYPLIFAIFFYFHNQAGKGATGFFIKALHGDKQLASGLYLASLKYSDLMPFRLFHLSKTNKLALLLGNTIFLLLLALFVGLFVKTKPGASRLNYAAILLVLHTLSQLHILALLLKGPRTVFNSKLFPKRNLRIRRSAVSLYNRKFSSDLAVLAALLPAIFYIGIGAFVLVLGLADEIALMFPWNRLFIFTFVAIVWWAFSAAALDRCSEFDMDAMDRLYQELLLETAIEGKQSRFLS